MVAGGVPGARAPAVTVATLPLPEVAEPTPGVRPEAAVPCAEPFDSPEWRFSVDWEGSRAILVVDADSGVRLLGETGADLTARFPELARAGASLRQRPAVLDGVVAVLDSQGRPDLAAVARRAVPGADALRRRPATYLATDVLQRGGVSLQSRPLDDRLAVLHQLVVGGDTHLQAPETVAERGRALAAAARGLGLPALLARRGSARYHAGAASPDRLRLPLDQRCTCVVAGCETLAEQRVRLLLAEHDSGRLMPAGGVEVPPDRQLLAWLRRRLAALRTPRSPFDGPVPAGIAWMRPALTATVRHAGRDRGGRLRRPLLVAVRDDVEPLWCVRRGPVPPPPDTSGGGFVPTLLMPLPLDAGALLPQLS